MRKKFYRNLQVATTTDLGNWHNRKLVLYLEDFANPNNGLTLVPNHFFTLGLLVLLHNRNEKIIPYYFY